MLPAIGAECAGAATCWRLIDPLEEPLRVSYRLDKGIAGVAYAMPTLKNGAHGQMWKRARDTAQLDIQQFTISPHAKVKMAFFACIAVSREICEGILSKSTGEGHRRHGDAGPVGYALG